MSQPGFEFDSDSDNGIYDAGARSRQTMCDSPVANNVQLYSSSEVSSGLGGDS